MELSVVSPVYQNEEHINQFISKVYNVCSKLNLKYQIILVNDGSSDRSWEVMSKEVEHYSNIVCVDLDKNYGQHKAILAGLSLAEGNWVVVMDSDLEEDPFLIEKLYKNIHSNTNAIQIIRTRLIKRTIFYRILRWLYYGMFSFLVDFTLKTGVSNFGIYSRDLINQIKNENTIYPFFPALIAKYSNKIEYIETDQSVNIQSKSTYSLSKLIKLAGLTIVSNSKKPLYLIAYLGFLASALSGIYGAFVLIEYFIADNAPSGWSSLALLISIGFSLNILSLGMIAIYIASILEKQLNPPNYKIRSIIKS